MSLIKQDQSSVPCSGPFNNAVYSLIRKDLNDSLFDDDEDLKSRYLEREQAFKRINDQLEKKSSEIFEKIEKFRYHESPTSRFNEVGQGDASIKSCGITGKQSIGSPPFDFDRPISVPTTVDPNYFSKESYFDVSRSSSAVSNLDKQVPIDDFISQRYFQSSTYKRPATAVVFPNSSRSQTHTESSIRRAETARPIEGLEEKHQLRLQKATESVLKCVQSKLVNYEQRLADMHLQYRQKIQENTMLEAKVKAMEEDRKRLLKSVQMLQSTTEKFSKSAENSKINLNIKAQAFASLKKELDILRKDQKHKNGIIQGLQTRLDRCSEDNKRLKSQSQSTHINMKQQQNEDKYTMDELKQRVIQLEQQNSSFQTTLAKQAQLIKSLRSQKVCTTNILQKHKLKLDATESVEVFD